MSANVALAVPTTPTVAALRADLAAAVAKLLAAEAAVAKLQRAATDAAADAVDAQSAVARASDAVTKAGAIDADALAEAVLADKPAARLASKRDARAALADAEEALAGAKSIRDALNGKASEAKESLGFAAFGARAAALAVVQATSAANLAAFLTETERLQRELQDRLAALAYLRAQRLVPHIDPTISQIISFELITTPGVPIRLDPASTAGKWEAMIARLTRDPKAPAALT